MSLARVLILAAAVAAIGGGTACADERTPSGVVSNSVAPTSGAVSTHHLMANAENCAESIEVFHGRWRPYWRGYYHGSSGYSPRPNLYYGPVVYPPAYAYRPAPQPVYSSAYVYAPPCPCPGGYAVASAAPIAPTPAQVIPTPTTPPVPSESQFRYDGGPNSLIPPAGNFRPVETVEPPLAVDASLHRRVQAAPVQKPAGYAAYGEPLDAPGRNTLLVKNKK